MSRGAEARSPDPSDLERHPSLDDRFDAAVRIVAHDPRWSTQARRELRLIGDALGELAARLEHVGSTAVPGLAAKPILDLQLSVRSLEPRACYGEPLHTLGYLFVGDPGSPDFHLFAKPPQRPRSHHLHVCLLDSEHEARHLAVRDLLRADPAEALRYETLKRDLMRRVRGDRLAYIAGKRRFVDGLEGRALDRFGRGGADASSLERRAP